MLRLYNSVWWLFYKQSLTHCRIRSQLICHFYVDAFLGMEQLVKMPNDPFLITVAPDAIHHHIKTCRTNMKNMHFVAPEYGSK